MNFPLALCGRGVSDTFLSLFYKINIVSLFSDRNCIIQFPSASLPKGESIIENLK